MMQCIDGCRCDAVMVCAVVCVQVISGGNVPLDMRVPNTDAQDELYFSFRSVLAVLYLCECVCLFVCVC